MPARHAPLAGSVGKIVVRALNASQVSLLTVVSVAAVAQSENFRLGLVMKLRHVSTVLWEDFRLR